MHINVSGLSYLQKEQVQLGLEHGLTKEQTCLFAKPCYNYKKMEQIRMELEATGKTDQVTKRHIPVWWGLIPVGVVLLGMIVVNRPVLILKKTECVLYTGEPFVAMDYVEEVSGGRGELRLPDVDTDKPGRGLAVYRLCYGNKEIVKTMHVTVKKKPKDRS